LIEQPNTPRADGMSDEDKYTLGLAAQTLMTDQTFKLVMSTLAGEAMDILVNTEPKDRPRREDCYFLYKALQSVTDTLNSWVTQAIQIEDENNRSEEGQ